MIHAPHTIAPHPARPRQHARPAALDSLHPLDRRPCTHHADRCSPRTRTPGPPPPSSSQQAGTCLARCQPGATLLGASPRHTIPWTTAQCNFTHNVKRTTVRCHSPNHSRLRASDFLWAAAACWYCPTPIIYRLSLNILPCSRSNAGPLPRFIFSATTAHSLSACSHLIGRLSTF